MVQRQEERQGRRREAQFLWSIAQVLLWQLESARQPAMLRHPIFCLSSLLLSLCVDPQPLSPSLRLSWHLTARTLQHFPATLYTLLSPHTPVLLATFICIPMRTFCNPVLRSVLTLCWLDSCVHVGGCGSSSLHSSGSAPDPAALQAGGESRQEHFPASQEALLQRSGVSIIIQVNLPLCLCFNLI